MDRRFACLTAAVLLAACGSPPSPDAGPDGTLVDRALEVTRTLDGQIVALRIEEPYEGQLLPFAERFVAANAEALGIRDPRVSFLPRGDHRLFGDTEVALLGIALDGVEIFGADVRLMGRGGAVRLLFVNAPPLFDIDATRPELELTQAREAFEPALMAELSSVGAVTLLTDPRLSVLDAAFFNASRADLELTWIAEVMTEGFGPLEVFVSGADGELRGAFALEQDGLEREIRDGDGELDNPDPFGPGGAAILYDERGARDVGPGVMDTLRYDDATALYLYFEHIHTWLGDHWGIDSYDGEGAPLRAAVGWQFSSPNATYSSSEQVFRFSTGMVADDIVGHEVGHAALRSLGSGGPVYAGIPGAINESLADALGYFVDPNDFQIGEDTAALGTLRDIASPSTLNQPECAAAAVVTEQCSFLGFLCDPTADHGGVHTNSGVANRALAIMLRGSIADGGGAAACSANDHVEVAPVRPEVVEAIYGLAFALVGRRPSFVDLRTTLAQSCEVFADSGEASHAECRQVANAFARVGVGPVAVADLDVEIEADPVSPGVAGEPVLFIARTTGGVEPYLHTWRFGDGGESALAEDTHSFEAAGTYVITVEVEDGMGQTGDATLTFEVEEGGPAQCRNYDVNDRAFDPPVPTLPDCPDDLGAPAVTGTTTLRLINNLSVREGHLGRSRYCGYNVESGATQGFGFVGTVSVHPADEPERPRPCAPHDCSEGMGYEVLLRTTEGNPWRYRYYDATHHLAWEGEASEVRRDPTLQPELDRLVAELFDAFRPAALACLPPE